MREEQKEKEREELVKKGTIGRGWAVGEERRGSFMALALESIILDDVPTRA